MSDWDGEDDEPRDTVFPPYVEGSETSRAAAEAMFEHAPNQRAEAYFYVLGKGDEGATMDEWFDAMHMLNTNAGGRFVELRRMGLIYETRELRPTRSGFMAKVYRAHRVKILPHTFEYTKPPPRWRAVFHEALEHLAAGDVVSASNVLESLL